MASLAEDVFNTIDGATPPPLAPLDDPSDTMPMTEEEVYQHTQSLRRKIIRMGSKSLEQIQDPKIVTNLLKAANDMDKLELGKRRLKNEEQQTRNQAQTHALIADVLNAIPSVKNYRIEDNQQPVNHNLDDSDLPPLDIVPGETDIGTSTMTHEEFVKK